ITTDVWMKPEQKGYRCLIGPYTEFAKASQDLQRVKTLSTYKEAFIRVVGKGTSEPVKQTKPMPKPAAKAKPVTPVAPVAATRPNTDAFKAKETPAKAAPKQASQPVAKPTKAPKPAQPIISNDTVQVRLKTILQGKTFVVPYLVENNNQFYMEHGKPWNRLNYASSIKVCQQLSMDLASVLEFKMLRASGVMEKNNWPLQLPYWGKDKKGLFADREPNQLTGTSLLNVICVK
ncbi:SPOR domain-containing protein, partial [Vibrio owensii]